jgi:hypothetical protein
MMEDLSGPVRNEDYVTCLNRAPLGNAPSGLSGRHGRLSRASHRAYYQTESEAAEAPVVRDGRPGAAAAPH